MKSHPDDAHALVLNRILALPRGSEAGNVAHRDYQATRLNVIRPKLMAQKSLLSLALLGVTANDAKVSALDDEIAADWLALDSRLDDWRPVHPDAVETMQEAPF